MSIVKRISKNEHGGISIAAGLAMLAGFSGMLALTDISSTTQHKAKLQQIADEMALTAAIENQEDFGNRVFSVLENFETVDTVRGLKPMVEFDDVGGEVTVTVSARYHSKMSRIFGYQTRVISAQSSVGYLNGTTG